VKKSAFHCSVSERGQTIPWLRATLTEIELQAIRPNNDGSFALVVIISVSFYSPSSRSGGTQYGSLSCYSPTSLRRLVDITIQPSDIFKTIQTYTA
jgi:hypothetical protein